LNRVVEQLSDRVRSDFRAMKEFSENASHEMQTPLAIIRSKLEVLLQDPQLSQTISAEVHAALNAVQRLSRMNQALLLITKIEHGQFSEVHEILVGDVIHRQLDELSELMRLKELKVNWERNEAVTVHAHPELSEILISNLVGNAIKHNAKKGEITIDVHPGGFSITNTSPSVVSQPSEMFRRFSKADASSTSLGLGLSISEKICHRYGWRITYSTNGNKHTVSVNF